MHSLAAAGQDRAGQGNVAGGRGRRGEGGGLPALSAVDRQQARSIMHGADGKIPQGRVGRPVVRYRSGYISFVLLASHVLPVLIHCPYLHCTAVHTSKTAGDHHLLRPSAGAVMSTVVCIGIVIKPGSSGEPRQLQAPSPGSVSSVEPCVPKYTLSEVCSISSYEELFGLYCISAARTPPGHACRHPLDCGACCFWPGGYLLEFVFHILLVLLSPSFAVGSTIPYCMCGGRSSQRGKQHRRKRLRHVVSRCLV